MCRIFKRTFNKLSRLRWLVIFSVSLFMWMVPGLSLGKEDQKPPTTIWGLVSIPPPLTPKAILDGLEQGKLFLDMGFVEYETYVRTCIPVEAGIRVVLRGVVNKKILHETQTDSQGEYAFFRFDGGEVLATAMVRVDGVLREAKARSIMNPNRSGRTPLPLRTDLITIKGRVVHADGSPAGGVIVMGKPALGDGVSPEELRLYPEQFAVTAADGTYELPNLRPAEFTTVAFYLTDGRLESARGLLFAILRVKEVSGMSLFTLKVPLISEESLANARRYNKYLNTQNESGNWKREKPLKEVHPLQLPTINGFIVVAPNIVLTPDFDHSVRKQ